MGETLALIGKVILIIAGGMSAVETTVKVARESGIGFSVLWAKLPTKLK